MQARAGDSRHGSWASGGEEQPRGKGEGKEEGEPRGAKVLAGGAWWRGGWPERPRAEAAAPKQWDRQRWMLHQRGPIRGGCYNFSSLPRLLLHQAAVDV